MIPFKGGRGKKAPYETMMIRIPVPIKPLVQVLSEGFRQYVARHGLTEDAGLDFMRDLGKNLPK